MKNNVTILDIDALELMEMDIKMCGKTYKLKTPSTRQMLIIKKDSAQFQEISSNFENNPESEQMEKAYFDFMRRLTTKVLKMFNDDVDDKEIEKLDERAIEVATNSIVEFSSEAFMKGRGNGI